MNSTTRNFMTYRLSHQWYHALALVICLTYCIQPIQAQSIILGFDSLPSAQGWSYVGSAPENSVFSLGTNTLQQNSIGIGASGSAMYTRPAVNVTQPFTLDFRGRIFQEELFTPPNSFGYGIEVDFLTRSFIVGLGANRVMLYDGNSAFFTISLDTSLFHDYRLTGSPITNTWQFSIDGTIVGTGVAASFLRGNDLSFGDIASPANAQGEWTRMEFTQAVPEPGTIFLTSATALGFGFYFWRRKRQQARLAME